MSIDGVLITEEFAELRLALASMGPSMSIDGVFRRSQTSRALLGSFNGAVDEHRRSLERSSWFLRS